MLRNEARVDFKAAQDNLYNPVAWAYALTSLLNVVRRDEKGECLVGWPQATSSYLVVDGSLSRLMRG